MQETESLAVDWLPVADIRPYPGNPRVITDAAVAKVAASIKAYGWRQPIVVDQGMVILVGHTRFLAAKSLDLVRVPVHVAKGLTPAAARAYRLADNRTHEEAKWDLATLASEIAGLQGVSFDLGLLGFDVQEFASLGIDGYGATVREDEVPDLPATAVTRLGDVWILGEHRVMCGDATNEAHVAHLLRGSVPELMVTDPPYGVEYDPTWRAKATGHPIRASGKVLNDDRADWRAAWKLFGGPVAYVWHGALHAGQVQQSLLATGLEPRAQIIWAKSRFVLSRGHYHWRHEACWYATRKGKTANWQGGRKKDTVWQLEGVDPIAAPAVLKILKDVGTETTVWEIPFTVDDGSTGHGTQKPVECMRRPMLNSSCAGAVVYDPFLGSGSSVIAAQTIGRRCVGLELDPRYCDVIVQRWQSFTGKTAKRESDGKSWAEAA